MSLVTLMNNTCTFYSVTYTKDAYGGRIDTLTSKLSGIPCRIRLLRGDEIQSYEKINVTASHRIYTLPEYITTSITTKDIITIGSIQYNILYINLVDNVLTGIPAHYEIDVREVTR